MYLPPDKVRDGGARASVEDAGHEGEGRDEEYCSILPLHPPQDTDARRSPPARYELVLYIFT